MIEQQANQEALTGIRSLAFELIKSSPENERKINIEDHGDYCSIQLSVRIMGEEFRERLDRAKSLKPELFQEM